MDHNIHFEALKAILNDISWPEFKGLNLDIFVWIHVSEWFKSNQVFTVRSKGKAFHLSFWRSGPLIHGWDKVSCFNLKFLNISIINSKWLKIIIMSNYQITINKLTLNIGDWFSVKLNALKMWSNLVIVKSDYFHWVIIQCSWEICLRGIRQSKVRYSIANSADEVLVLSF